MQFLIYEVVRAVPAPHGVPASCSRRLIVNPSVAVSRGSSCVAFFADAIETRRERAFSVSSEYDHGGVEDTDETRAESLHFLDDVVQEERAGSLCRYLMDSLPVRDRLLSAEPDRNCATSLRSLLRLHSCPLDEEHVSDLRSKSMVPMVEFSRERLATNVHPSGSRGRSFSSLLAPWM